MFYVIAVLVPFILVISAFIFGKRGSVSDKTTVLGKSSFYRGETRVYRLMLSGFREIDVDESLFNRVHIDQKISCVHETFDLGRFKFKTKTSYLC